MKNKNLESVLDKRRIAFSCVVRLMKLAEERKEDLKHLWGSQFYDLRDVEEGLKQAGLDIEECSSYDDLLEHCAELFDDELTSFKFLHKSSVYTVVYYDTFQKNGDVQMFVF